MFPLGHPARLAVFASGGGSNLKAILDAFPAGHKLASVRLVLSDKVGVGALKRAGAKGVPAFYHPFPSRRRDPDGRGREAFERFAEGHLRNGHIDLICLAGFMRILSPSFNVRWAGRLLNIHPSLLPDFKGLHPQRQALRAGRTEAGCSVHFVDAGVDTGQVILQRRVPVLSGDTEETLGARILEQEHQAYPAAIRSVLTGAVRYAAQSELGPEASR